jgi:hypothetical protein
MKGIIARNYGVFAEDMTSFKKKLAKKLPPLYVYARMRDNYS